MLSLSPGPLFKDTGLHKPFLPVDGTASPDQIHKTCERSDDLGDGLEWPADSPVAQVYDVSNSPAGMIILNNNLKQRPKSGGSRLRAHSGKQRISTPDPGRHSPDQKKNTRRHKQCLDSKSAVFEPQPKVGSMWMNQKARPAWKPTEESDSSTNTARHTSCRVSKEPATMSLESKKPPPKTGVQRRVRRPPISMSDNSFLLHPDLKKGNKQYMWLLAKCYDTSDMKRLEQLKYRDILMKQQYLGYHSDSEYARYMKYIEGPRKRQFGGAESLFKSGNRAEARPKSSKVRSSRSGSDDRCASSQGTERGEEDKGTRPKTSQGLASKSSQESKSPSRSQSPTKENDRPKKRRRRDENQQDEARKSESPAARMLRIHSEAKARNESLPGADRPRSLTPRSGRSSAEPSKSRSSSRTSQTTLTPRKDSRQEQRKESKDEAKEKDAEGGKQVDFKDNKDKEDKEEQGEQWNGARPKSSKEKQQSSKNTTKDREKSAKERPKSSKTTKEGNTASNKDEEGEQRPKSSRPKSSTAQQMAKKRSPYLEQPDLDSIQAYHPHTEKSRPKSSKQRQQKERAVDNSENSEQEHQEQAERPKSSKTRGDDRPKTGHSNRTPSRTENPSRTDNHAEPGKKQERPSSQAEKRPKSSKSREKSTKEEDKKEGEKNKQSHSKKQPDSRIQDEPQRKHSSEKNPSHDKEKKEKERKDASKDQKKKSSFLAVITQNISDTESDEDVEKAKERDKLNNNEARATSDNSRKKKSRGERKSSQAKRGEKEKGHRDDKDKDGKATSEETEPKKESVLTKDDSKEVVSDVEEAPQDNKKADPALASVPENSDAAKDENSNNGAKDKDKESEPKEDDYVFQEADDEIKAIEARSGGHSDAEEEHVPDQSKLSDERRISIDSVNSGGSSLDGRQNLGPEGKSRPKSRLGNRPLRSQEARVADANKHEQQMTITPPQAKLSETEEHTDDNQRKENSKRVVFEMEPDQEQEDKSNHKGLETLPSDKVAASDKQPSKQPASEVTDNDKPYPPSPPPIIGPTREERPSPFEAPPPSPSPAPWGPERPHNQEDTQTEEEGEVETKDTTRESLKQPIPDRTEEGNVNGQELDNEQAYESFDTSVDIKVNSDSNIQSNDITGGFVEIDTPENNKVDSNSKAEMNNDQHEGSNSETAAIEENNNEPKEDHVEQDVNLLMTSIVQELDSQSIDNGGVTKENNDNSEEEVKVSAAFNGTQDIASDHTSDDNVLKGENESEQLYKSNVQETQDHKTVVETYVENVIEASLKQIEKEDQPEEQDTPSESGREDGQPALDQSSTTTATFLTQPDDDTSEASQKSDDKESSPPENNDGQIGSIRMKNKEVESDPNNEKINVVSDDHQTDSSNTVTINQPNQDNLDKSVAERNSDSLDYEESDTKESEGHSDQLEEASGEMQDNAIKVEVKKMTKENDTVNDPSIPQHDNISKDAETSESVTSVGESDSREDVTSGNHLRDDNDKIMDNESEVNNVEKSNNSDTEAMQKEQSTFQEVPCQNVNLDSSSLTSTSLRSSEENVIERQETTEQHDKESDDRDIHVGEDEKHEGVADKDNKDGEEPKGTKEESAKTKEYEQSVEIYKGKIDEEEVEDADKEPSMEENGAINGQEQTGDMEKTIDQEGQNQAEVMEDNKDVKVEDEEAEEDEEEPYTMDDIEDALDKLDDTINQEQEANDVKEDNPATENQNSVVAPPQPNKDTSSNKSYFSADESHSQSNEDLQSSNGIPQESVTDPDAPPQLNKDTSSNKSSSSADECHSQSNEDLQSSNGIPQESVTDQDAPPQPKKDTSSNKSSSSADESHSQTNEDLQSSNGIPQESATDQDAPPQPNKDTPSIKSSSSADESHSQTNEDLQSSNGIPQESVTDPDARPSEVTSSNKSERTTHTDNLGRRDPTPEPKEDEQSTNEQILTEDAKGSNSMELAIAANTDGIDNVDEDHDSLEPPESCENTQNAVSSVKSSEPLKEVEEIEIPSQNVTVHFLKS